MEIRAAAAAASGSRQPRGLSWSYAEDQQLLTMVREEGTGNWPNKASRFTTARSAGALQSRYQQKLQQQQQQQQQPQQLQQQQRQQQQQLQQIRQQQQQLQQIRQNPLQHWQLQQQQQLQQLQQQQTASGAVTAAAAATAPTIVAPPAAGLGLPVAISAPQANPSTNPSTVSVVKPKYAEQARVQQAQYDYEALHPGTLQSVQ